MARADKVVLALAEGAAGFMCPIAAGRQSMAGLHGKCFVGEKHSCPMLMISIGLRIYSAVSKLTAMETLSGKMGTTNLVVCIELSQCVIN